jgi:signal peptide peptidase SppA
VAPVLKKAFSLKRAPAVVLVIDSPGGSPVQSHLIYKRIRTLAAEKNKSVIVFVEDVCASGGYMIACAGDEIVVDPASIVGSIGVVSAGFGFVEALQKLGIQRRVYTSGESKVILDPFQPEKPEDIARLKAIQEEVHDLFIDLVRRRRGDVLSNNPDIFSGMFWSARRPSRSGWPTARATSAPCCRSATARRRLKPLSAERSFFGRRGGVGVAIGAALAETVLAHIEDGAMRGRYRL